MHRIDKDTSGLLMIAKNDFAHSMLAEQLAEHSITRVYTALVYNNFAEDEGTVDVPIGRDAKNRLRQTVFPYENGQVPKGAKRAVTNYRVLKGTADLRLLRRGCSRGARIRYACIWRI